MDIKKIDDCCVASCIYRLKRLEKYLEELPNSKDMLFIYTNELKGRIIDFFNKRTETTERLLEMEYMICSYCVDNGIDAHVYPL